MRMRKAIDGMKKIISKITARSTLLILCAAVFVVSAYMLISYYAQGAREEQEFRKLADVVAAQEPSIPDSADAPSSETAAPESQTSVLSAYQLLHEQNPDMIGWVKIEGTAINYPVMYTPNDGDFYLNHGFDRQKSKSGVPFIDLRCAVDPPGTNTIIYGHHMKNGTMFADLAKYKDKKFWKDHPIVRFDTLSAQQEYEIIAVFQSKIFGSNEDVFKHYNFINANSQADFDRYIVNIKALSLYDTGVTAEYGDLLLSLVTCDYHDENGQMVVVARKKATA